MPLMQQVMLTKQQASVARIIQKEQGPKPSKGCPENLASQSEQAWPELEAITSRERADRIQTHPDLIDLSLYSLAAQPSTMASALACKSFAGASLRSVVPTAGKVSGRPPTVPTSLQ